MYNGTKICFLRNVGMYRERFCTMMSDTEGGSRPFRISNELVFKSPNQTANMCGNEHTCSRRRQEPLWRENTKIKLKAKTPNTSLVIQHENTQINIHTVADPGG